MNWDELIKTDEWEVAMAWLEGRSRHSPVMTDNLVFPLDSVDTAELAILCEQRFGILINEVDFDGFTVDTLADFMRAIVAIRKVKLVRAPDRGRG